MKFLNKLKCQNNISLLGIKWKWLYLLIFLKREMIVIFFLTASRKAYKLMWYEKFGAYTFSVLNALITSSSPPT